MALSANRTVTYRNGDGKIRRAGIVLTGAVIYKGALVGITVAGKLKVMANSTTLKFYGIAEDGPVTGNGTLTATCLTNLEVLLPTVTAITVGQTLLTKIFSVDDQTATAATTLAPQIGIMTEFVAANSAYVLLGGNPLTAAS